MFTIICSFIHGFSLAFFPLRRFTEVVQMKFNVKIEKKNSNPYKNNYMALKFYSLIQWLETIISDEVL